MTFHCTCMEGKMMIWKRKWLLAGLLALALMLLAGTAMAEQLRFGTVDGSDTVNLRASASSSSKWLGAYDEGTWLRILGQSGNFYKVKTPDGKTGYMSINYVYVTAAAMGTIGFVEDAGSLNLRKSASQSAKVLGQYDDGTPCVLLSQKNGWYHVSVDGKAGYFDADYIRTKYQAYSPDVVTVVTSNGGSLRMRQGPGTGYGTIRSFKNSSYVMILQKGDGWWKVTADGKIGFMDSSCLRDGIVRKGQGSTENGTGGSSSLSGSKYAYVANPNSGDKLNLRESASKDSHVLGRYGNGTKVTLLSTGSTWCRVSVSGKTGYMMTRYLSLTKPESGSAGSSLSGSKYAYVSNPRSGDKLRLRASASKSSKSLGSYANGTKVTLVETGAQWCKVKVDGKTGYMMTEFLALKNTSGVPGKRVDHPDGTYVNLRRSASQSSGVLTRVPHGENVTVLSPGKYWTKIRYEGYTGYMMTKFLSN